MGGKGSGRKPDPNVQLRKNYENLASTHTEDLYIPNLSGVRHEIEAGTHSITTDDLAEGSSNLYDQTVSITGGTNIDVTGTYPNFTIATSNSMAVPTLTVNTAGGYMDVGDHIEDGTIHFLEGNIDHTAIKNIGTNTHAQIDTHITNEPASSIATHAADTDAHQDEVTLVTASHDYLSITGQAITLGQIDISDDTNLTAGTGISLTGDTLSTDDANIDHDSLNNFEANEHIDWTTDQGATNINNANITGLPVANTALTAGTNITLSTNTLNVDDAFIKNDADDTSTGKITAANFAVTGDNNTNDSEYVPMVLHGTDDTPPTASNFPRGTIYIQYDA